MFKSGKKGKIKQPLKGLKLHQNGSLDSWISHPKINSDELQSTSICNSVLLSQNTCSILSSWIFLSSLLVSLVEFGNIMWKLENRHFYTQP